MQLATNAVVLGLVAGPPRVAEADPSSASRSGTKATPILLLAGAAMLGMHPPAVSRSHSGKPYTKYFFNRRLLFFAIENRRGQILLRLAPKAIGVAESAGR